MLLDFRFLSWQQIFVGGNFMFTFLLPDFRFWDLIHGKHHLLWAYLYFGNSILVPPNIQARHMHLNYSPIKLLFLHIDLLTEGVHEVHILYTFNIEQQWHLINEYTRPTPHLQPQLRLFAFRFFDTIFTVADL